MEPENVITKMQGQLQDWRAAADPRYIFLDCYSTMTGNVLAAIEQGRFQDGPWVKKLLHLFADYYFNALACYECGEPEVPRVWKQVHKLSAQKKMHVLQHLLLGVNAHINYDLVLTLYDMLQPEWATLPAMARKKRYADHRQVNIVIAETIDRVQDELIEVEDPLMDWVDRLMGRVDELLLSRLITSWREGVWENTMAMLACRSPEEREAVRREVESEVLRRARWLAVEG